MSQSAPAWRRPGAAIVRVTAAVVALLAALATAVTSAAGHSAIAAQGPATYSTIAAQGPATYSTIAAQGPATYSTIASQAASTTQPHAGAEIIRPDARLDQIAEQLESDPVHVDRSMGNGDVAAVRELLRSDVDDAPSPTYVVLIHRVPGDDLPDQPDELAALLHDRVGVDGLYVVGIGRWVEAVAPGVSDVSPSALANAAFYATEDLDATPAAQAHAMVTLASVGETDRNSPDVQAAIAELTDQLAADPLMNRTTVDYHETNVRTELTSLGSGWDSTSSEALGLGFVVGVVMAVLAAVVLAWRATRHDAVGLATDIAAARTRLRAALATIDAGRADPNSVPAVDAGPADGHPLAGLDTGLDTCDGTGQSGLDDPDRRVWFHKAAEAANELRDSHDPVDVVGATVLAEGAVAALVPHQPFERPRPCYLNPLHGRHGASAALPGDKSGMRVPVCTSCAGDIEAGRRPDILRIKQGLRVAPYYRRHDVWSVSGFGALRADVADLVLAGARAGSALPGRLAHESR